jgi:DNA-binding transcriptional ArsR family regulator
VPLRRRFAAVSPALSLALTLRKATLTVEAMQDVLRALAEPRRQEILRLLGASEMASGEIARHFSVSRPAISQHLQVLKAAGLVTERRLGTRHLYQARPEGLAELRAFINAFWDDALARLAHEAEAEERRLRGDV